MITNVVQACDVFDMIKQRFNREPVQVSNFANRTFYSASGLSAQNNTWIWRPDMEIPEIQAVPSASIRFPLFFGAFEITVGNDDPVTASVANSFLIINNAIVQNIAFNTNTYNLQGGAIIRYGNGTFAGRPFPLAGIVEDWFSPYPQLFITPYLSIQEFTDGGGAIFLNANISFNGFRIDMS